MQSLSLSAERFSNHGRGLQRGLTISCDVLGQTFPLTTTCFGSYSEQRYGSPSSLREWAGLTMQLTVDSFDGDRAIGRFGGTDVRNDGTLTKRREASAPGTCP